MQILRQRFFAPGMALAFLVAFMESIVASWWSSIKKPFGPQSISHKTDETPAKISFAALGSVLKGIIFLVLFVLVVWQLYSEGVIP